MSLPKEHNKPYTALYRRWRPRLFSEVVGQEHVTRTLQNALATGRVAHAYLFCGLRGTGKTTMAKLLARALNCQEGVNPEPCNKCRSCLEVLEGRNMDVLEIDAASNRGIDEIRDLRDKARYATAQNSYKVYIVDEVHMLTNEAFNALLKILEEPPPKVVFILATTEVYKLPLTVVSRCQRFDFRLLEAEQIVGRLQEVAAGMGFAVEEETLYLLARQAEGSMRDALGFLEQCRAYGGEKVSYDEALSILGLTAPEVIYRLLQAVIEDDAGAGLTAIGEVVYQGRDLQRFLRELILYLRKLILLRCSNNEEKTLKDAAGLKPYLTRHREQFDNAVLLEMLEILQDLAYQLKGSPQPQFLLELAFLRMIRAYRFRHYLSPGALLNRLEELEAKLQAARAGGPAAKEQALQPVLPPTEEKETAVHTMGRPPQQEPQLQSNRPPEKEPEGEQKFKRQVAAEKEIRVKQEQEQEMAPGAELGDIEQLRDFWEQRLLPEIKKQRKHNIHALLQEGSPVSCKKGLLTVSFPPTHSIHKGRIEAPQNRKYIESLLQSMLGSRVALKVVLQDNLEPRRAPAGDQHASGRAHGGSEPFSPGRRFGGIPSGKEPGVAGGGKAKKENDFFISEMLELFNGRLIETGGEDLNSRDFWSCSFPAIDRQAEGEGKEDPLEEL